MPENIPIFNVYWLCRQQLVIAPMGGAIGIRMEAAKIVMDMLGIEDQVECAEKLNIFSAELFKKDA